MILSRAHSSCRSFYERTLTFQIVFIGKKNWHQHSSMFCVLFCLTRPPRRCTLPCFSSVMDRRSCEKPKLIEDNEDGCVVQPIEKLNPIFRLLINESILQWTSEFERVRRVSSMHVASISVGPGSRTTYRITTYNSAVNWKYQILNSMFISKMKIWKCNEY